MHLETSSALRLASRRQHVVNIISAVTFSFDCLLNFRNDPFQQEHSNSRFDSIRFVMRIDSFCKKSAFRFSSCHAVFALNKKYKHIKYSDFYNTIQYNTKFVKRHVAVASEALANRTVKKHRRL